MEKLTDLPNIGKEMEKQLNMVGIYSYNDLKERGSKKTWLDIKSIDPSACINRLYGLEGAIRNIRWHNLPDKIKTDLKDFYTKNKK